MKKEYIIYGVIALVVLMAASKIRSTVPLANKLPEF